MTRDEKASPLASFAVLIGGMLVGWAFVFAVLGAAYVALKAVM